MKMKKLCAALLLITLCLTMLAGCGGGDKPPAETKTPPAATKTPPAEESKKPAANLKVSILNSSGYIFNELYISPSASSEWGDDLLGSTSILKKGGAFDVSLAAYDFSTYDIRVVDEDEDVYLFERVTMSDGCEVDIIWENELAASVSHKNGDNEVITGSFVSGSGGYVETSATWLDMTFYNNDDWDFTEVYIYESGTSDYGYNHVANAPLTSYSECEIGVDYYDFYDVELLDTDGDTWYFTGVELGEGCFVEVDWSGDDIRLTVNYPSGGSYEYYGDII